MDDHFKVSTMNPQQLTDTGHGDGTHHGSLCGVYVKIVHAVPELQEVHLIGEERVLHLHHPVPDVTEPLELRVVEFRAGDEHHQAKANMLAQGDAVLDVNLEVT